MAYIPHTHADTQEMLESIGYRSLDDLFQDIPKDLLLPEPLPFPAMTEFELTTHLQNLAAKNRVVALGRRFLGAGAYAHFIPAAAKYLVSRGEFMTSYTPYQAEVSQGTLQAVFEYQSHIAALTGLDVANASMYDGASALAEAVTMAVRHTGKRIAYLPEMLHPSYLAVCRAFLREIDVEVRVVGSVAGRTDYASIAAEDSAAVVIATPNALGVIEDGAAARAAADRTKALLIACVNPTSLAVLASPGDYGADIAVGEGQPLGIPLSFGGPYAGFFACKRDFMRKMPGRIVGRARDKKGTEGFVLTLQTREQHIRRDKATSNICTNQGLFALMTCIYMTLLGREGLVEVAETSMVRTQQLVAGLRDAIGAEVAFDRPYFHEATLRLPVNAETFVAEMRDAGGVIAGWPVSRWFPKAANSENLLLVNCTEVHTAADVAHYIETARAVAGGVGASRALAGAGI